MTLVSALLALAGLVASLFVRRRRVLVRVTPGDAKVVPWWTIGASPRTTTRRCRDTVTALLSDVKDRLSR